MMLSSTERAPFSRTMFCCTSEPSRTWATSLRKTVAPFVNLTGILLRSSMVAGIALVRTVYWVLPIFAVPAGNVRFCVLTALTTSSGVKTSGQQLVRIDIDHDLPVFAAGRGRQRHAGDRRQLLAHAVDAVIVELLLVQAVGAEAELKHRHARRVELHDDRRLNSGRHQRADCIGRRDDLRDREVEIHVRLEIDLLNRQSVERLRLDILDAVDVGADRILAVGGDALLHLRRAEAGVLQITVTTGMWISGKISVGIERMRCRRETGSTRQAHRTCAETSARSERCPWWFCLEAVYAGSSDRWGRPEHCVQMKTNSDAPRQDRHHSYRHHRFSIAHGAVSSRDREPEAPSARLRAASCAARIAARLTLAKARISICRTRSLEI